MFFEFLLLLIINHLLRLRTGWLKIEDLKMDGDGSQMDEDGCGAMTINCCRC